MSKKPPVKMIDRYDLDYDRFTPSPDGKYVLYSDYEALKNLNDRWRKWSEVVLLVVGQLTSQWTDVREQILQDTEP